MQVFWTVPAPFTYPFADSARNAIKLAQTFAAQSTAQIRVLADQLLYFFAVCAISAPDRVYARLVIAALADSFTRFCRVFVPKIPLFTALVAYAQPDGFRFVQDAVEAASTHSVLMDRMQVSQ
ncbi:MAG TPA: hypothetical protein VGQ87_02390 [Patescibacteria group bacterium]|nr:hypothetical protein [Patescibacteria group bacterium]